MHFATHALVDDQVVWRSALALAPGSGFDGFVGASDLASLDLHADLVVLSGCRTADGVVLTGEGVQGLTAPLLEAGARAVLATRWAIGDRDAGVMIDRFYAALARGFTVGDALQRAQRDAIAAGVNASVWGAFTLVGDPTVKLSLRPPKG
jgi:CHAT domain-containing protein